MQGDARVLRATSRQSARPAVVLVVPGHDPPPPAFSSRGLLFECRRPPGARPSRSWRAHEQAGKAEQAAREQAELAEQAEKELVREARKAEREQAKHAHDKARERYEGLTKAELSDLLDKRDLPKTGNVDELLERLVEADSK